MSKVIARFVRHLEATRRPNTATAYSQTLTKLQDLWREHPPAPKAVSDLTADMIKPLPIWLSEQGLAQSSINRHLAATMQFVEYLFREELAKQIEARAYEGVKAAFRDARKARKVQKIPRTPGSDVVKKAVQSVKARNGTGDKKNQTKATKLRKELIYLRNIAVVELLRATGLRVGELVALQRWNLDREKQRLLIEVTKSKAPRALPVDDQAWKAVLAYLSKRQAHDGATGKPLHTLPLFARHDKPTGQRVLPISTRSIQRVIEKVKDAAGIEIQLTPYSFRYQFGRDMFEATRNIEYTRLALGHEDPKTTYHYVPFSQTHIDDAMRELKKYREENGK